MGIMKWDVWMPNHKFTTHWQSHLKGGRHKQLYCWNAETLHSHSVHFKKLGNCGSAVPASRGSRNRSKKHDWRWSSGRRRGNICYPCLFPASNVGDRLQTRSVACRVWLLRGSHNWQSSPLLETPPLGRPTLGCLRRRHQLAEYRLPWSRSTRLTGSFAIVCWLITMMDSHHNFYLLLPT